MRASWWTVVVLSVGITGLLTSPAQAHPFGDPQEVRVVATDGAVRATWKAPVDDLTALAMHLGLLTGTRSYVFQDGAFVPEESDASDAVILAASSQLRDYLLQRVTASTDAGPCQGSVPPIDDLVTDGARIDLACPGDLGSVALTVTTLTDVHEGYRTMATGPDGQRHLYSLAGDTRNWNLAGVSGAGDRAGDGADSRVASAAVQLAVVSVALVGAVAAGWFVVRRRRRPVQVG